jgi:hypothetical protein
VRLKLRQRSSSRTQSFATAHAMHNIDAPNTFNAFDRAHAREYLRPMLDF